MIVETKTAPHAGAASVLCRALYCYQLSISVLQGHLMRNRRFFAFLFVLATACPIVAQDRAAELQTALHRAQHLRHGINASEWFAQSAEDYSAARTNRYTDDGDIALMAKLGFDNVRLSIDAVPLEQGLDHQG